MSHCVSALIKKGKKTMTKFAIVIHGGASESSSYLKKNIKEYEEGLREALIIGANHLKKGASAIKSVEATVSALEDNPLFNAGRGSVLNSDGTIAMDASLMNGKDLRVGAVCNLQHVKNPITLARIIMTKTKHVFFGGKGALELAKHYKLKIEQESYFITEHQLQHFLKIRKPKTHGTVGAVALDKNGNLAAATSTGGTGNCLPGRIGDSCVIGAGCYANNASCAISGTGLGESIIRGVVAHTIAMLVELKKMPLKKACDTVITQRNRLIGGDIGVIALNRKGDVVMSFNTEIMKRAWLTSDEKMGIKIYR